MSKLLSVTSSPRGEAWESTTLAETFAARRDPPLEHPDLEVDPVDLSDAEPLPVSGGKGADPEDGRVRRTDADQVGLRRGVGRRSSGLRPLQRG